VSEHRFHDLLRAARSAWHRWFTVVVGKCRSIQVRSTAGSSIPTDRPIIILTVLGGILTAGFLLRLISIIAVPNINQADEVFQTLEQAHRIVYGFGLVPWEFEVGARSFLMPGALAALMWASRLFDAGPIYYLLVVYAMLSLLSTACILVVFLWGERFFGSITALVCAGIVVFSTDLIYFGPRASPEVVSAHLVLVACYFAEPGFRAQSKSRLSLAGVLLGLGFALRIQLAPAIAFFVLWTGWRSWRDRLMPILIGALSVILLAGILDWVTWGYPFESSWRYVDYNLFHGMQRDFGVNPWYQYADYLLFYWGPGIALLVSAGYCWQCICSRAGHYGSNSRSGAHFYSP
jgi:4-amino-4-deoxy-L-arabinose transferase-like glycosyltransferase